MRVLGSIFAKSLERNEPPYRRVPDDYTRLSRLFVNVFLVSLCKRHRAPIRNIRKIVKEYCVRAAFKVANRVSLDSKRHRKRGLPRSNLEGKCYTVSIRIAARLLLGRNQSD